MALAREKEEDQPGLPCASCKGQCCTHVTIEIDKPRSKAAFDTIRWYVLHENVLVYIGTDKKWNVEFRSRCTALDADGRCLRYVNRPAICSSYPTSDEACEFQENPVTRMFTTVADVDRYCARRQAARKRRRSNSPKRASQPSIAG